MTDFQPLSTIPLESAHSLSQHAGWNQTLEDWQRLVRYEPDGCFAAVVGGQLAGTVTTTRYGTRLGWIGMVLVDPRYRRRGLATLLMQQALDYLESCSIQCVKLDATPEGRAVYQRIGFEPAWDFHRWRCDRKGSPKTRDMPTGTPQKTLSPAAIRLDQIAFGADRSHLLRMLAETSIICEREGGFGLMRPGQIAHYLGPVSAEQSATADSIVRSLCAEIRGPILWDIPSTDSDAVQLAHALGFQPVRTLTRMRLGADTTGARLDWQHALADPGTG